MKAPIKKYKAVWSRLGFGPARVDEHGAPVYENWELRLDGSIHFLSLCWALASAIVLLCTSLSWRYWIYSAGNLLIFSTSACYNTLGCAYRVHMEELRRLDQASIFLAFAADYTVFVTDWRLLIGTWVFAGSCAFLKLALGHHFEELGFLSYGVLLFAPLVTVRPHARAYPFIVATTLTVFLGVVAGYMNNYRGGNAFWHACILAAHAVYWSLVYSSAQRGIEYYL